MIILIWDIKKITNLFVVDVSSFYSVIEEGTLLISTWEKNFQNQNYNL